MPPEPQKTLKSVQHLKLRVPCMTLRGKKKVPSVGYFLLTSAGQLKVECPAITCCVMSCQVSTSIKTSKQPNNEVSMQHRTSNLKCGKLLPNIKCISEATFYKKRSYVICVDGSPTDWAAITPTGSPGSARLDKYLSFTNFIKSFLLI